MKKLLRTISNKLIVFILISLSIGCEEDVPIRIMKKGNRTSKENNESKETAKLTGILKIDSIDHLYQRRVSIIGQIDEEKSTCKDLSNKPAQKWCLHDSTGSIWVVDLPVISDKKTGNSEALSILVEGNIEKDNAGTPYIKGSRLLPY